MVVIDRVAVGMAHVWANWNRLIVVRVVVEQEEEEEAEDAM